MILTYGVLGLENSFGFANFVICILGCLPGRCFDDCQNTKLILHLSVLGARAKSYCATLSIIKWNLSPRASLTIKVQKPNNFDILRYGLGKLPHAQFYYANIGLLSPRACFDRWKFKHKHDFWTIEVLGLKTHSFVNFFQLMQYGFEPSASLRLVKITKWFDILSIGVENYCIRLLSIMPIWIVEPTGVFDDWKQNQKWFWNIECIRRKTLGFAQFSIMPIFDIELPRGRFYDESSKSPNDLDILRWLQNSPCGILLKPIILPTGCFDRLNSNQTWFG